MVGLLSGMDSEDRSPVVPGDSKDVSVVQEESTPKAPTDESQPTAESTDNVDEIEHVKELKSILKQRGQYTFRKVKVDFDLIPKKIPYDENDYTIDIQIIEKEPVKIKSWAAIFAAKKAEAEAEAAALAEAEEALKKAEEVKKREALKKASKAKLKKLQEQPDQIQESSRDQILQEPTYSTPEETMTAHTTDHKTLDQQSTSQCSPVQDDNQLKNEIGSERAETNELPEEYKLAEYILEEVLNLVKPEQLLGQLKNDEEQPKPEQKEDVSSCTESLAAESSEHLQDEHTNNDLEDISTQDEASLFLEDSNLESLSQEICNDRESITKSHSEEMSTAEDISETQSELTHVTELISHSDDDSLKLVDVLGKKVPKKMLVTAASLVEEIISEMPKVLGPNEDSSIETIEGTEAKTIEASLDTKPQETAINQENNARQKRWEFKSNNSIFEHVKRSLESAAPEILETAVGVLEEIEKIVVEKVGPAIQ